MKDKIKEEFTEADLPITKEGRIYHLNIRPDEMARDIILVGDPDRVGLIAKGFLSKVEVDRKHRGLRSITGVRRNTKSRVSIIAAGMGSPSMEIVINEVFALNEIDLKSRTRKNLPGALNIIRLGTCGALQKDTQLGTPVVTEYSAGLDNAGHFVESPATDSQCLIIENNARRAIDAEIAKGSRFRDVFHPYAARADPSVVEALSQSANKCYVKLAKGITVTCPGFFAAQGRDIAKLRLTVPDIDAAMAQADTGIKHLRFENMDMETAILLYLCSAKQQAGISYRAGSICVTVANRRENTFCHDIERHIMDAAKVAFGALDILRDF